MTGLGGRVRRGLVDADIDEHANRQDKPGMSSH
jgi:hypothetical protein